MTVDEIYRFLAFVSNEEQVGSVAPDQFNLVIKAVNIDLLKEKMGLVEEFQPGIAVARQGHQVSRVTTDHVSFLYKKVDILKNTSGRFTKPSDFAHFSSMRYIELTNKDCGEGFSKGHETVDMLTHKEFEERYNNSIIGPTMKDPIGSDYYNEFEVLPEDIDRVELTYVRYPQTPERAIDPVTGLYDSANSTQLEWPEIMHGDFAVRCAQYYGSHLNETELYQILKQRQTSGQ